MARLRELTVTLCDIKNLIYRELNPLRTATMPVSVSIHNEMQQTITQMNGSPRKKMKLEYTNTSNEDEEEEIEEKVKLEDTDTSSNEDEEEETEEKDTQISEYVKMIEKNKAERLAFIESLKFGEAKAGLLEAIEKVTKKKVLPAKRVFKLVENVSRRGLRKSRRLINLSIDVSRNASKKPKKKVTYKSLPHFMTFKQALERGQEYESYVKDINIVEPMEESKFVTYTESVIQKITPDVINVAKVTRSGIIALAWYPSAENLIIAAGGSYGRLGIWNVDSESSPYVLRPHLKGISKLQFNPLNCVQLVSSSYDGILRCADMVKCLFTELYNVSHDTSCTWFDILSQSTYLVAQRNGQVALVDSRSKKKRCEKLHTCHDFSLKTVNIHPVNRNCFVTSDNNRFVRLWDLRKLQKAPIVDISHHKRSVNSAYFSPVTGNSILTTSSDNKICIFDSTHLTPTIKLKQEIKYNRFVSPYSKRRLNVFRATWLPNSDDAFVVGSMQNPRRIQVYGKNMKIVHTIMHDNLTTVSSTNIFHPFRSALAGGNFNGDVLVFT